MAAAALQPAAGLNLGGASATVRTNPESADTKLIGHVIFMQLPRCWSLRRDGRPARNSVLMQAEASEGKRIPRCPVANRAPFRPMLVRRWVFAVK